MIAIDEFNPAPAPDYETLLFQFKALCRMYNSTRSQCSFMAKTICDLNKQIADGALDAVESERAANAQLTAELESLRQERDGLRADAERYRWLRSEIENGAVQGVSGALVELYDETMYDDGDELDAAIDAAMAKEQGDAKDPD